MDTLEAPHNLVTYVEPLSRSKSLEELWEIPAERALAENAIWYFLTNPTFTQRDRDRLQSAYKKRGTSMFIWKYYTASRNYLGGYKALSATLALRRVY